MTNIELLKKCELSLESFLNLMKDFERGVRSDSYLVATALEAGMLEDTEELLKLVKAQTLKPINN